MTDPLLLPEGARLVHIGPHKTGTTALQHALHTSRPTLLEQGVVYAGSTSQAYLAAHGLTGQPRPAGVPDATEQDWLDLVDEARAAGDRRMVVSSEAFAAAGPEHADRLAEDLGRDRVHVVRMVRRYDTLLPSQWQQSIRAGGRRPTLDRWVADLLEDPSHPLWSRQGFAGMTRMWADVVGPENVSVVVIDESDREWSLRVFERFLGLRTGTLPLVREGENRSSSLGEAEMLRRFNSLRRREDWPPEVQLHYVLRTVLPALRGLPADPEGGRIQLPAESLPALREATARDVAALLDLGVRVVGDVGLLEPVTPPEPASVPAGAGAVGTMGAARAATVVAAVVDRALTGPVRTATGTRAERDAAAQPSTTRIGLHLLHKPAVSFLTAALAGTALVDDPSTAADELDRILVPVVPGWQVWLGAWQEELLLRRSAGFAEWIRDAPAWPSFDDALPGLVRRFGADRVVVVPVDACEPDSSVRRMVAAAGPDGLRVDATAVSRSLLVGPELELVRSLIEEADTRGWEDEVWIRYVRDGVVCRLLTRPPARRGRVPAVDPELRRRLESESTRYVAALRASGAQLADGVAGLDQGFPASRAGEVRLPSRAAALALAGVVGVSLSGA